MQTVMDCNSFQVPRQITDLHCDQLKRLSLDTNHLTQLPELPVSLEKISVQNNLLDRLPGKTYLPRMDILCCSFRHKEVPCSALWSDSLTPPSLRMPSICCPGVTRLEHLQSLFLSGNCLTELPSDFGQLKNLKEKRVQLRM